MANDPGTVWRAERRQHSRLYALRTQRGWSIEELASRAGVSARTIYNAEVIGRQPHRATRVVLAHALGCDPDALLNRAASPLAARRQAEGLSLQQLAFYSNLPEETVARLEAGDELPDRTTAEQLASALRTSVDVIFRLDGPNRPAEPAAAPPRGFAP